MFVRPNIKSQFTPIINKNLTDEMKNHIRIFHFRCGIDCKKLGYVHMTMMVALKSMVKSKKEEITEEDKMMLETYEYKVDFTYS